MLAFSDFAPVMTILPVEKMSPVVFGSLMRMTTAENLAGLYSAFLHHWAIFCRSIFALRSAVATRFCRVGGFS